MPAKNRKRRESFGAIRKLPSGRYQASYVGPDGERYTAPSTFTAIEDAR
ncbi:MAG TPA: site-specific integrase, partial [Microbacterium sp.]|nr:site-specific integrase [Microbacterium sp.]